MPGTYSQIRPRVDFSTKHREPWITPYIAKRLYPYMGAGGNRRCRACHSA